MPSVSNAEQFFKRCQESPDHNALFQAFIDEKMPETEWLDFKEEPKPKDLNEKWFEAISGFANTDGGVLFFGIKADKVDDIDCANELKPVADFEKFASRLRELSANGTTPPVQGVQVQAFSDGSPSKRGYVVCYIPQSKFKPHRAETAGKKEYHIRAGQSFLVANHSFLQQMFYPKVQPRFWAEVVIHSRPEQTQCQMTSVIRLHNDGTGSANECVVSIKIDGGGGSYSLQENKRAWTLLDSPVGQMTLQAVSAIHPGFVVQVANVNWHTSAETVFGKESNTLIPLMDRLVVSLLVFGRDMEKQQLEVRFNPEDFRIAPSVIGNAYPIE